MLDNLMDLVKQYSGDAIVNNAAIPNERNEEAIRETGNSIVSTLQHALAGGGIKDIMGMFSNGAADQAHPVVQQAVVDASSHLQQKLGIGESEAAGIAGNLVPNVLNQLTHKTADPANNGFNIQDIFNKLSGGKTSGLDIQGMVNKFKGGLDKDGDGDVDMQDLSAAFSGGNGSSIMDAVKGLFK